jgi:hypothetical protein
MDRVRLASGGMSCGEVCIEDEGDAEAAEAEKVSFVPSTNLTSTAFSNGTRLLSSDAGLLDFCAAAMINRRDVLKIKQ